MPKRRIPPIEYLGKEHGRLTPYRIFFNHTGRTYVECRYRCGRKGIEVRLSHLLSGNTKSCKCLVSEGAKKRNTTHGMSKTPTWHSWQGMMTRCYNANVIEYPDYGGRGIIVCDRWRESFENFLADMGIRPDDKTLDRFPDKNGDYTPENCRWATQKEQGRNQRSNWLITFNGRTQCLSAWAEEVGISQESISRRIRHKGMTIEEALTIPPKPSTR